MEFSIKFIVLSCIEKWRQDFEGRLIIKTHWTEAKRRWVDGGKKLAMSMLILDPPAGSIQAPNMIPIKQSRIFMRQ